MAAAEGSTKNPNFLARVASISLWKVWSLAQRASSTSYDTDPSLDGSRTTERIAASKSRKVTRKAGMFKVLSELLANAAAGSSAKCTKFLTKDLKPHTEW
eukprot:CAMPEP_0178375876 /NCGR_PEP_ID=MMETSP0689_2-20121128/3116_1 /TAXON_ID=160604 /ORGANISM="Amphidinium massartii, Strain CS-259" /LENGTH=99 /DNA_ID=CAMNT_0019995887 /DNA_START=659 /DNA_END=955 /DNA_ORIENTATION=+